MHPMCEHAHTLHTRARSAYKRIKTLRIYMHTTHTHARAHTHTHTHTIRTLPVTLEVNKA